MYFIYRSYGGYPGPRGGGGGGGGPPPDNQNETLRRVSSEAGIIERIWGPSVIKKPLVCQTVLFTCFVIFGQSRALLSKVILVSLIPIASSVVVFCFEEV